MPRAGAPPCAFGKCVDGAQYLVTPPERAKLMLRVRLQDPLFNQCAQRVNGVRQIRPESTGLGFRKAEIPCDGRVRTEWGVWRSTIVLDNNEKRFYLCNDIHRIDSGPGAYRVSLGSIKWSDNPHFGLILIGTSLIWPENPHTTRCDIRASDGNRTRTTCLGSRSSAIELRSHDRLDGSAQS